MKPYKPTLSEWLAYVMDTRVVGVTPVNDDKIIEWAGHKWFLDSEEIEK